jgi:hypothetical protein
VPQSSPTNLAIRFHDYALGRPELIQVERTLAKIMNPVCNLTFLNCRTRELAEREQDVAKIARLAKKLSSMGISAP